MKSKVQRWNYGIRKENSGYGPYICDIYFGLKQIDYHTCCESRKDAISIGTYWVAWLKKCDASFGYDPTKFKNWIDWYGLAYAKELFPPKT